MTTAKTHFELSHPIYLDRFIGNRCCGVGVLPLLLMIDSIRLWDVKAVTITRLWALLEMLFLTNLFDHLKSIGVAWKCFFRFARVVTAFEQNLILGNKLF